MTHFTINQKNFSADPTLFDAHSFTVQSTPHAYEVTRINDEAVFSAIIKLLNENEKTLLLIDEKLIEIYQPIFTINQSRVFAATACENFKSWENVTTLIEFLEKNQFTKSDQLIVVGGGTIQDIAAFVSGIYKRGIRYIHFPTTLVSMCDSCIGGKASVNYEGVKNQLALFSAPHAVFINPHFLKTLSDRDIQSGLGEILKSCLIGGAELIHLYQSHVSHGKVNSFTSYEKLISAALCVKKAIIEADEFEFNERRCLNYGHTVGHAIEALSDYAIPHGQAIVIGMMIANEISYTHRLLNPVHLQSINQLCFELIDAPILSLFKKINVTNLIDVLQKDKKIAGDSLHFVLLKSPGSIDIVKIKLDEALISDIQAAFKKIIEADKKIIEADIR